MAFEFLPPEINWSTHCGDAPTFGRFSTMFDYPTKAITQASVYPKEACQPWLHYNMRLGNLAVDTNLQVGATGVYGGNVTAPTFIGNLMVLLLEIKYLLLLIFLMQPKRGKEFVTFVLKVQKQESMFVVD